MKPAIPLKPLSALNDLPTQQQTLSVLNPQIQEANNPSPRARSTIHTCAKQAQTASAQASNGKAQPHLCLSPFPSLLTRRR